MVNIITVKHKFVEFLLSVFHVKKVALLHDLNKKKAAY